MKIMVKIDDSAEKFTVGFLVEPQGSQVNNELGRQLTRNSLPFSHSTCESA